MRVLALTKYDREAASTRQRILQYGPALAAAGIQLEHRPLLGNAYVRSLATGESYSRLAALRSYATRLGGLLGKVECDLIWVYAELFPFLPAAFERLAFRRGVPVIYDFDDAFFLTYDRHRSGAVRALLGGKLDTLIAGAAACTCGNAFLRDHALRLCPLSIVVPTVVDTAVYRPAERRPDGAITIGWIGSPSSWSNVRPVLPLLRDLCRDGRMRFRAVGAGVEAASDRFDGMELVPWSAESEVAEVQQFDIGIMPLTDAPFQRGKSGYKLVQYMACGVPAVASPVGVNSEILTSGSGILATTVDEWSRALERLRDGPEARREMGAAGRRRAVDHYSLSSAAPKIVELFRRVAASRGS